MAGLSIVRAEKIIFIILLFHTGGKKTPPTHTHKHNLKTDSTLKVFNTHQQHQHYKVLTTSTSSDIIYLVN